MLKFESVFWLFGTVHSYSDVSMLCCDISMLSLAVARFSCRLTHVLRCSMRRRLTATVQCIDCRTQHMRTRLVTVPSAWLHDLNARRWFNRLISPPFSSACR